MNMKNEFLPMKASFIYTEQYNLRVDKELKDDIRFLSSAGVEVSELVRPILRDLVKEAKKRLDESRAS